MIFRDRLFALPAVWVGCLLLGGLNLWAFPEPPIAEDTWQFDWSHSSPQALWVRDTQGKVRWYWFLTYHIENNTGEDRLFIPEITAYTDSGRIIPAGQDVPARVFKLIQERVDNPLLKTPVQVVGKTLQGPDFAKESVAVWPVPDEDVDRFSIFITGLSGHTQAVQDPATGQQVLLRKTLMLDYATPGTTHVAQDKPIVFEGQRWVMR